MVNPNDAVNEYIALLGDDTEEAVYLNSNPWMLDANRQDTGQLARALRFEATRFLELPIRPTFSLLAVLRETSPCGLRELILSCRCLSYQDWNLLLVDDGSRATAHLDLARHWSRRESRINLITLETPRGPCHAKNIAFEKATGDYLILVDGEGVIHPMALGLFARHLNEDASVNLIFSNEAEIDQESRQLANFFRKPPFDLFTLLRVPYLGRLLAVQRRLLEDCAEGGGFFRQEFEGIEEHDLWLRLALTGNVVSRHSPLFAYYRRADTASLAPSSLDLTLEKRRRLLAEHVPRAYPGAVWTADLSRSRDPFAGSSVWITSLPVPPPKLLVVIPFKDQIDTTIKCLESIEQQDHSLDILVVLVNNRSTEPATLTRLQDWTASPRTVRYEILDHDGAFNFARLNNTAIARLGHDRDLLFFLNNDVELTTPQALQVMAMQLLADREIGFVSIKLYYPGGNQIQHGGHRFIEHVHGSGYHLLAHAKSSTEFVDAERVSLCVTFACAMTRRETFEKLGGLEEVLFPNGYGDVDMCLRAVGAGYRNYYFGSLEGIHHESRSRGCPAEDIEFTRFHERHGQLIAFWRLRHLNLAPCHAWATRVLPWEDSHNPLAEFREPEASHTAAGRAPQKLLPHDPFPHVLGAKHSHDPRRKLRGAVASRQVDPSQAAAEQPSPQLALRYRLADSLVAIIKRGLGPVYGYVRSAAIISGKLCFHLKSLGELHSPFRIAMNLFALPEDRRDATEHHT